MVTTLAHKEGEEARAVAREEAIIPSVGVGWRTLDQKARDPQPLLALLGMNPLKSDQKDLSRHPTWWLLFEDLEPFLTTTNIIGNSWQCVKSPYIHLE